uniref:Uncharacterized protein n=1 Tax=Globodera rostochiensis TaxID=31243 RepID=A0A914H3P9_GLORO
MQTCRRRNPMPMDIGCIKTEAFKASFCCKEGFKYKCCSDPEQSFKLVKKNTTELIQELRAKTELIQELRAKDEQNWIRTCRGTRRNLPWKFLCCSDDYEGWMGCDTKLRRLNAANRKINEMPRHKKKRDLYSSKHQPNSFICSIFSI